MNCASFYSAFFFSIDLSSQEESTFVAELLDRLQELSKTIRNLISQNYQSQLTQAVGTGIITLTLIVHFLTPSHVH